MSSEDLTMLVVGGRALADLQHDVLDAWYVCPQATLCLSDILQ